MERVLDGPVRTNGGQKDLGRGQPGQGEPAGLGLQPAVYLAGGPGAAKPCQFREIMMLRQTLARPLAETTVAVRVSFRPCPVSCWQATGWPGATLPKHDRASDRSLPGWPSVPGTNRRSLR